MAETNQPGTSAGGVRQLLAYAGPHRGALYRAVALAIAGELCGMLPYVAVALFVGRLLSGPASQVAPAGQIAPAWQSGQATPSLALALSLVALLGQVARELLTYRSTLCSHLATYAILREMRRAVARKMEHVPLGAMIDTPIGAHKMLLVDTISKLEDSMAHFMPEFTSNIVAPLVSVLALLCIDWRMGLASFATLPLAALCYCGMTWRYRERMDTYTRAGNAMNAALVEYVNGIQVIKAFSRSASSYGAFSRAVDFFHTSTMAWYRQCWFWSAAVQAIMPCTLLGTLPVGLLLYMHGQIALPVLVLGLILPLGFIAPLMRVAKQSESFVMIKEHVSRVTAFLQTPELERPSDRAQLDGTALALRHVGFAYGETEVLHDLSLDIAPQTMVALVGPSGSGKSTVAKLLAGFWDPGAGKISLGGVDLRDMPAAQLAEHVSYVAQDTFLFDSSIRENIRMGRPGATDAQVEAAARAAAADAFIRALPQGYDTPAGDAGGSLSGGERQRVTIARAFLKNAPVIILDEATAYTDPESECEIQRALTQLVAGKTLIVIAHRLSTVRAADAIVVLEDGSIADTGTHEQLLERCELYRRMWDASVIDPTATEEVA